MKIRQASNQDAARISELLIRLAEQDILPSCTVSGGQKLLESMSPDAIAGYLNGTFRYHLVEEQVAEQALDPQKRLVGVIGMRDNSHLYHLFVAKTHQGLGLGKRLWLHAKDECLAKGNTGRFTVNSALNAQNVYLKLGFVPLGAIRENHGIKDIPMELVL
jgi:GNAT superfamily N-acetyltransferase